MTTEVQQQAHDLLHDAGNKRPASCPICLRERVIGTENADRFRSPG